MEDNEQERYYRILIEADLYDKYKALKDVINPSELQKIKKEMIKEFIEENANKGYDEWNNEEYVTNNLDNMINKSKNDDDYER